MPELPDLEVITEFLRLRLPGRMIVAAQMLRPIVVRDLSGRGIEKGLVGRPVKDLRRRGKLVILELGGGNGGYLVVSPMLAGRLYYGHEGKRRPGYAAVELQLSGGSLLTYADAKQMGKVYITDDLAQVPGLPEMGPDALDPELTLAQFRERLKPYRGEIKGVLTRQTFVAGIGNAYADEICWQARIYPFRKRSSLSAQEIETLYGAMREVLSSAIQVLRSRMGENIHVEIRDFLAVHGKGGEPCPRCGTRISQLKAQDYFVSFCRTCQPGTLIRQ